MVEFFNRTASVEVAGIKVTSLRMAFKITKDLTATPNKLDLQIWNLSEASRANIQTASADVKFIAGYRGAEETLFSGQATIINHTKNGPDWITHLESGDGVFAGRLNRINENFAPGTPLTEAFKKVAASTGLAIGNTFDEIKKGNVRNALTQWSKGAIISGVALEEAHKLAKTLGYEMSVQDGALQVIEKGKTVGVDVVLLNAATGLVGSPEIGEKNAANAAKARHVIKARSLIQQRLVPGRQVNLDSLRIKGFFRIEKVTFVGDTHDTPWYADLEMTAT